MPHAAREHTTTSFCNAPLAVLAFSGGPGYSTCSGRFGSSHIAIRRKRAVAGRNAARAWSGAVGGASPGGPPPIRALHALRHRACRPLRAVNRATPMPARPCSHWRLRSVFVLRRRRTGTAACVAGSGLPSRLATDAPFSFRRHEHRCSCQRRTLHRSPGERLTSLALDQLAIDGMPQPGAGRRSPKADPNVP